MPELVLELNICDSHLFVKTIIYEIVTKIGLYIVIRPISRLYLRHIKLRDPEDEMCAKSQIFYSDELISIVITKKEDVK